MSADFSAFLSKKGIELRPASSNTPQENPVAERFNRTASEAVTAMLSAGNFKIVVDESSQTLCENPQCHEPESSWWSITLGSVA